MLGSNVSTVTGYEKIAFNRHGILFQHVDTEEVTLETEAYSFNFHQNLKILEDIGDLIKRKDWCQIPVLLMNITSRDEDSCPDIGLHLIALTTEVIPPNALLELSDKNCRAIIPGVIVFTKAYVIQWFLLVVLGAYAPKKLKKESAFDGISTLIRRGADVNAFHNEFPLTPLTICAAHKFIEGVNLLLKHKANVNIVGKLSSDVPKNVTALNMSIYRKAPEIAKLLLEHGAKVNLGECCSNEGKTRVNTLDYVVESIINYQSPEEIREETNAAIIKIKTDMIVEMRAMTLIFSQEKKILQEYVKAMEDRREGFILGIEKKASELEEKAKKEENVQFEKIQQLQDQNKILSLENSEQQAHIQSIKKSKQKFIYKIESVFYVVIAIVALFFKILKKVFNIKMF